MQSFAQASSNSDPKPTSMICDIFNIEDVRAYLTAETTLVWDIDNTILETNQLLGSDQWFAHFIAQKVSEDLSIQDAVQEALKIYVPVQQKTGIKVVEPQVVDIIHEAQREGITTFCLTSRGDYIREATIKQLALLGLDFNQGIFKDIAFKIKEASEQALSHGVVFCEGGRNKGTCLQDIIARIADLNPRRLILIDDKRSYLENVQKVCDSLGIEFIGLRYGFLDEKIDQLNAKIVQIQLEKYKNPILSDEEAMILWQAKNKTKCGLIIKPGDHRAVLWGRGIDYETYEKICDLDPEMKRSYRKKGKFIEIDGIKEFCYRFKIPKDALKALLPKLERSGILLSSEIEAAQAKLIDDTPDMVAASSGVLVQFQAYRTPREPEHSQSSEEVIDNAKKNRL